MVYPVKIMRLLLLFLMIAYWSPVLTLAQNLQTSNAHAEVSGSAPGSSYTGKSDQLAGTLNSESGEVKFSLPLKSIKTGKSKRDKHMNEALETDKYPEATFAGKITSGFDAKNQNKQEITLNGDFTIHGVTHPVDIKGSVHFENDKADFYAQWDIDITKYNIDPPKILTYKVKPEHTITVSGTLNR